MTVEVAFVVWLVVQSHGPFIKGTSLPPAKKGSTTAAPAPGIKRCWFDTPTLTYKTTRMYCVDSKGKRTIWIEQPFEEKP